MNLNRKKATSVGLLILFAYAVLASSVIESKIVVMLSEVFSGVAVVGIAVLLLPFFKVFNKKVTSWYFLLRGIEGGLMVVAGVLFLFKDPIFLQIRDGIYIGHSYIFALAALSFYYLLYISKLVPRYISVWGAVASVLLILVNLLEVSNVITGSMLLYLPIITNEVYLAFWLIVKGFSNADSSSELKGKPL